MRLEWFGEFARRLNGGRAWCHSWPSHCQVLSLFAMIGCGNSKSLPGGFELLKWEDGQTF
jgi:hypothetical protein